MSPAVSFYSIFSHKKWKEKPCTYLGICYNLQDVLMENPSQINSGLYSVQVTPSECSVINVIIHNNYNMYIGMC